MLNRATLTLSFSDLANHSKFYPFCWSAIEMKPNLDKGRIASAESVKKEEKREGPQCQANTGKMLDVRVHSYKWFMKYRHLKL